MNKTLVLIALLSLSPLVSARMYQWVDPDTGTTQLSGKPPTWYRSDESGPRIIVYDKGRVIDDTGLSLSPSETEKMREEALISVEQDRQTALTKLQKAQQQKAKLESDHADTPVEVAPATPVEPTAPAENTAQDNAPSAEELRALIDRYEQMKTQDARNLVETATPETNPAPATQK